MLCIKNINLVNKKGIVQLLLSNNLRIDVSKLVECGIGKFQHQINLKPNNSWHKISVTRLVQKVCEFLTRDIKKLNQQPLQTCSFEQTNIVIIFAKILQECIKTTFFFPDSDSFTVAFSKHEPSLLLFYNNLLLHYN